MSDAATANHQTDRSLSHQPMIPITVCFMIGIAIERWLDLQPVVLFTTLIASWATWLLFQIFSRRHSIAACCLLYLVVISTGAIWHHARWNWFPDNDIGVYASDEFESAVLRGKLISEPVSVAAPAWHPTLDTMKPKQRMRFRVRVASVRDGNRWLKATGTANVHVYLSDEQANEQASIDLPCCGEEFEAVGKLVGSRPSSNPGQFDFQSHFRAKGHFATLIADSDNAILRLTSDDETPLNLQASLRATIDQQLHQHLDSENAAFASAVLLGNRDQMEADTRNRFMETGASHLLAISGLHVGILASGFLILLRLGILSRTNCLVMTILFVISYAWLVEFRPTVLRATILITVMCGARLTGRAALSWGSLTLALLIVLSVNPSDLFSLGTQLSFLAISSIIIGKSWIYKALSEDPVQQLIARTRSLPIRWIHSTGRQIRAAFCVSFLIWMLGLPLVAFHFHSVAIIAPLLNPLLLLPMALALYFGLCTIVCGLTAPPAAAVPATLCALSLGTIQHLINLGSAQELGHFWSAGPPGISVAVFYSGVFLFAAFPPTKLPAKWCILLAACWFAFGWVVPDRVADWNRTRQASLELIVIDVGHGSAALVKLPDGRNLLCDCGSLSGSYKAARQISDVLWHQRIERLDAVIISHADVDHFNALPELIDRFRVDSVWLSSMMNEDEADSVKTLFACLDSHSIPRRIIHAGSVANINVHVGDGVAKLPIEILGPPENFDDPHLEIGDNAKSIVLRLTWQGRSILLPGDVEKIGLESLLSNPSEKIDVLVAAHHGSKNSFPTRFTSWCRPDHVVISCGSGRVTEEQKQLFRDGHPVNVMTTDEQGALRFIFDADGALHTSHWNGADWQSLSGHL